MRKLIVSITMGITAGIIDVIPMVVMNLDFKACLSAFLQWLVLGVFINYIDLGVRSWIKGFIIAEMAVLPIIVIVSKEGFTTIFPIIGMSAILGSLIGYFGSLVSHER